RQLAPLFAERVARLDRVDFVGNTRAVGLIGAAELAADKTRRTKFDPAKKLAAQAVAIVQQHGVILRALPGDIIGFCPPLIIKAAELNDMFDRIEAAFTAFAPVAAQHS
ncbi:MAG: aminotransferase class III-fold pyridoxal phosphate-dependent enzyme, partial [Candidatus Puniceispirillum sp.]